MNRSTDKKFGRRKAGTWGRTAKPTAKRIANKASRKGAINYLNTSTILGGKFDEYA
jgi:hypothetical protein